MNPIRLKQLEEKIEAALRDIQPIAKVQEYSAREDALAQQYLQGNLTHKEFMRELENLGSIRELVFYNLQNFIIAIGLLEITQQEIEEAIDYQVKQTNLAHKLRLHVRYYIRLDKSETGKKGATYGVQLNSSGISSDDERLKRFKEFVFAQSNF